MDLHPGIHGSLLATPPAGYRYLARDAEHVFLHSRGRRPFSPVHQGHWAELVRFGGGDELVHSASWPVLGRRHWVVELDDFGYPAYLGRHVLSARFRRTFELGGQPARRSPEPSALTIFLGGRLERDFQSSHRWPDPFCVVGSSPGLDLNQRPRTVDVPSEDATTRAWRPAAWLLERPYLGVPAAEVRP